MVDDGIVVKLASLTVNGRKMPAGLYFSSDLPAANVSKFVAMLPRAAACARVAIGEIRGLGAMAVSG